MNQGRDEWKPEYDLYGVGDNGNENDDNDNDDNASEQIDDSMVSTVLWDDMYIHKFLESEYFQDREEKFLVTLFLQI